MTDTSFSDARPDSAHSDPSHSTHADSMHADPLLQALITVCRHYQLPASPDSVLAGLPLKHGILPSHLFVLAANNAGLDATDCAFTVTQFTPMLLPLVAQLADQHACVILAVDSEHEQLLISPHPPCRRSRSRSRRPPQQKHRKITVTHTGSAFQPLMSNFSNGFSCSNRNFSLMTAVPNPMRKTRAMRQKTIGFGTLYGNPKGFIRMC